MAKLLPIKRPPTGDTPHRYASIRPDYRTRSNVGRGVLALVEVRNAGDDQVWSLAEVAPVVRRPKKRGLA